MYKELEFTINGTAPLLLHNGQLSDPLNEWAKRLKALSGKKTKSDDDYGEMARIEWYGGLYLNDQRQVIIPGENIEKMIIDAARKHKLGKDFEPAMLSDGNWVLTHDGPKDVDKLWEDKRFRDRRSVRVGKPRIMRTRPLFRKWSLNFTVSYLSDLVNKQTVEMVIDTASRVIGLGDYRPKFGRFEVAK